MKFFTKIFANILDFELISATFAEFDTIIFEINENAKFLDSILTYENMNSFFNNESVFYILDLFRIDKILIIIDIHFVNEILFSNIQMIFVVVIFEDVRKFL